MLASPYFARVLAGLLLIVLATPVVMRAGDSSSLGQASRSSTPKQLKKLSLEQLGKVEVVTANKEPTEVWNTPAAIFVLTQDDIRRSGVTNVPDALRLVPGVNVARVNGDRNWVVAIRGLGDQYSKYVLVLIDGRSVYTPLFGGVFWTIDNVMLEDIDRIEVIRGPGGTIWGTDAVNGIINIITKSAKDSQGLLASAGGGSVDEDTEDLRYGGTSHGFDFRVYGFGFVRGAEHHEDGQPNYDWSHVGQAGFRSDWVSGRDNVTLQGDAYLGHLGDAQPISTFTPPATVISYQSTNVFGGNLLGRWRRELPSQADLYMQGFWAHDDRVGPNFGETRDTFDVDFLHRTPPTQWQQFTYGVGARWSPSTTQQTVATDNFVPASETESTYSGFLQEELRFVPDRLALTLGSKLEHNSYTGFEYEPSGRLLFTPREDQSLWASISRAVRIPDRVDENIDVDVEVTPVVWGVIYGNRDLRAERLIAYEGGYRGLWGKHLYVTASAFHNVYDDLIAQSAPFLGTPTSPPFPAGTVLIGFEYRNGIRGTTNGFELAPEWQPFSWWRFRTAYSYLHVNLEDAPGFSDPLTLTTLHGSSPNSQVVVRSQIDLPKHFEFDQTFRYIAELPAQDVSAYETADVRLGRHLAPGLDLSVVGQNLLQPHHEEFGISPGPNVGIKRGVYAKLVWTSK
ncbi:MAG TPA: TonB-dependent receptor plug domain-containing protein [Acidobacteriaceae bacterium]|jgi:iron complex outermembrane receptor protein|nr:TonB-dependent receptor plug domain-containing protein [Acidobacteriaceae bacterium]